MRSILVLALVLACAPPANAADRIVGLLTLPEVFGSAPCDRFAPEVVSLYASPDSTTLVGSIRVERYWTFAPHGGCEGLSVAVERRSDGDVSLLPAMEYEYEAPAAIVLEQRGRWFRVRLAEGAAWVSASDRDEYLPLQRLLAEGLTHLTEFWDHALASEPGGAERVPVAVDPRRNVAGYLVPTIQRVRVVLQPGQNPDSVRAHYRASAMGSRSGANGTRVLSLETGSTHPLFARPDRTAPIGVDVETNRCAAVLETAHRNRVLVFDRRPGWYEVARRSHDGREPERVWLEEAAAWTFHPVSDDSERERLATEAWGALSRPVQVTGFAEIADALWIEIEVLSHSPCESIDEPTVRARGWIPAHAASGEVVVWFSSRGC